MSAYDAVNGSSTGTLLMLPHRRSQSLQAVSTIGLDIAKYRKVAFQVHGIDAEGKVLIRRQLKRRYVLAFFASTVRMMKALRRFWPLLSRVATLSR